MPGFDAKAWLEAHRPWTFTAADGRVFTSRHVGAPTVQRFEERLTAARSEAARVAAVRWLLRMAFPWRFSYRLRGDPVEMILHLNRAARDEALADFFVLAGVRMLTPPRNPKTSGTPSPAQTARRT